MKYSIAVYDDHAIITGPLSPETLMILMRLCKNEGFTHMTSNPEGPGFKLIRLGNDEKNARGRNQ